MRPFKPEHYLRASVERLEQAKALYLTEDSYALSIYVAGVGVECMLRAFKARRDPTFDERHDLQKLFKASGLLEVDKHTLARLGLSETQGEAYLRELQAWVNVICVVWSNDCRYASEDRFRAHLKKDPTLRARIKGDILKANARRLLDAAQQFINKGVLRWTSVARSGGS